MRFVVLLVGGFAVIFLAFIVIVRIISDDTPTNCEEVRDPRPGAWQTGDFAARERIVEDLSFCERLQGRTQAEVEALLGPPSGARSGELRYRLFDKAEPGGVRPADVWAIFLGADGRVSDTRYDVVTVP